MKLMAVLIFILILSCAPAGAQSPESGVFEVPCTREGVEEFMEILHQNGIEHLHGYPADEAHCFNVTPEGVAEETDIRIFKFSNSCWSFALVDGQIYDLCESIGGYGFLNAVPWDYDDDGRKDLLVASSWGSGLHRSEISVFNRAKKKSTVIYSTMYDEDPQVDLMADVGTPDPQHEGMPALSLHLADILLPEDQDFARLRYRIIGPYEPAGPLIVHEPVWDGAAAAPLFGTWRCTVEESDTSINLFLEFCEDGSLTMLETEGDAQQYEGAGTVSYRVDNNCIVIDTEGEMDAWAFSVSGDELQLCMFGPEPLVFTRDPSKPHGWMDNLQPRYQPGDTSRVVIDYGTSACFTREQMDAAIGAIEQRFLTFYNCELHTVAYTSDEESSNTFRYYADAQTRKTGKNYVDGIVFHSSFHTPPEDRKFPGSGFNPDEEYTGWYWYLLLAEDGAWEIVNYGQC